MMKTKYLIYGILVLAIIGVVFVGGCIQKPSKVTTTLSTTSTTTIVQPPTTSTITPISAIPIHVTTTLSGKIIQSGKDFLTYENFDYGFRIKFPRKWETWEDFIGDECITITFNSPDAEKSGASVIVGKRHSGDLRSVTLDQYTTLFLNNLKEAPGYKNFSIIESNDTKLANNPAHRIVYTNDWGPGTFKNMVVYTIKDNALYLIQYTANTDYYLNYIGTAQEMIDSFEII